MNSPAFSGREPRNFGMRIFHFLAAATAVGGIAAPLSAQSSYPYQSYPVQQTYPYAQPYQQTYPQQGYGYGQQGYTPGYNQGYSAYNQGYTQNPVGQIINSLLGNRYSVTDRQAVTQCASAAMTQAAAQYGNRYDQGYGHDGYNRGYSGAMRVTSITDVQRRYNGLRVTGLMSSGYSGQYGNQYDNQYGYQNRDYSRGEVSFRCNVSYNGQVTNVRIGRNNAYRG
jgi:hypothetical protein